MKRLILLCLLCLGCGGGGGGGGDNDTFAGVWRGTLRIAKNNCNFPVDQQFQSTLTVNQSGTDAAIRTPSGNDFNGTSPNREELTANKVEIVSCGGNVTAQDFYTITMNRGAGDLYDSEVATVTISDVSQCDGSLLRCELVYTGTFSRDDS
jgi:hypothetical protein